MNLPTPAQIRSFYPRASADDAVVQAYIDDAALIAGNCAGVVAAVNSQASIVRWIAIHLMAVGNMAAVTSESIGDASKSYGGPTLGLNLNSTPYGQRALLLDPSGELARLGQPRAKFVVV
jgi:hypothetical protein